MANHTPIEPMIDGIRRIMRTRGYSPRTEDSYLRWIERFSILDPYRIPAVDGQEGVVGKK